MSTSTAEFEPEKLSNAFIQRVDSDQTEDSPFSSALTTPVDEDVQLFHGIAERLLGRCADRFGDEKESSDGMRGFLEVIQDEAKLSIGDALKAAPTPSPSLDHLKPNPALGDPLNSRGARPRAGSIYSQPNRPLPIAGETPDAQPDESPFFDFSVNPPQTACPLSVASAAERDVSVGTPQNETKPASEAPTKFKIEDPAQVAQDIFSLLPFDYARGLLNDLTSSNDLLGSILGYLSFQILVPNLLRILLFLPWCVLAGGAILLFPSRLEYVIFSPGYVVSPKGIHRLAFWTDVASQLVGIFLGCLVILCFAYPAYGVLVVGGVAAQFVHAWRGFEFDRNVPLGDNDDQALYLVWKEYSFADAFVNVKMTDKGFLVTRTEDHGM